MVYLILIGIAFYDCVCVPLVECSIVMWLLWFIVIVEVALCKLQMSTSLIFLCTGGGGLLSFMTFQTKNKDICTKGRQN